MFNVSLSRVAKARDEHEPLLFLFLNVNLDFLEKRFAHTIWLENDLDLSDFIRLNGAIHRNVSDGSGRIAVENSFADSLDQVLNGEVTDVFDGKIFL
jgi:hypothetical protein